MIMLTLNLSVFPSFRVNWFKCYCFFFFIWVSCSDFLFLCPSPSASRFPYDGAVWTGWKQVQQHLWCFYGSWHLQCIPLFPSAQQRSDGTANQVEELDQHRRLNNATRLLYLGLHLIDDLTCISFDPQVYPSWGASLWLHHNPAV